MTRPIAGVAGTNALKLTATRRGLDELRKRVLDGRADLDVKGVPVPDCPDVPPQPIGLKQTRQGALYRALAVLEADPTVEYGIGIENGILLFDEKDPVEGGVDPAVVCIVRRGSAQETFATGEGVPVEGKYILLSLGTGQQKTCGKFIAEETGYNHANWHKDYSGGATDREELIAHPVMLAFAAHFAGH